MDTAELTTVLREATSTLDPPPGFADAVLRGGRRRRRRRMTIAASVVAVLAVLAGGTTVLPGDEAPSVASPTRGDLGNDQQFLNQAIAAWNAGKDRSPNAGRGVFDDLRGDPRVYWAGDTLLAGRAAVVMQDAYLHPHDDMPPDVEREQTLVGLVGIDPADNQLKLLGDQFRTKNDPPSGYFQFGPGDRTMLFIDYGTQIYMSPKPIIEDGTVKRDWNSGLATDGVVIARMDGVASSDIIAVARNTSPARDELQPPDRFRFWPASDYLATPPDSTSKQPHRSGLPWDGMDLFVGQSDGNVGVVPDEQFNQSVSMQLGTGSVADISSAWHITAGLPDGRLAVLGDLQSGVRPAQIYAVLMKVNDKPRVLEGEIVDQQAVLPVKFRMPDKQGWVIANYGKQLKYRTTVDGPWLDAGTSAALVPDETVQVLVDSTTVNLPR